MPPVLRLRKSRPGSGQYGAGQVLAMIVILLLGLAFAPLILLFILWVRLSDWVRSRRHRKSSDQRE
jgi:hypothetical protein